MSSERENDNLIDMETLERVAPIIRNAAHPIRLRVLDYKTAGQALHRHTDHRGGGCVPGDCQSTASHPEGSGRSFGPARRQLHPLRCGGSECAASLGLHPPAPARAKIARLRNEIGRCCLRAPVSQLHSEDPNIEMLKESTIINPSTDVAAPNAVESIDTRTAHERVRNARAILLDVRGFDEFAAGHAEGAVVHSAA